jgi:ArsR family transcriptional regulator, arsenate/arsenite/antimonite-responsive transcriptional repressor
VAKRSVSPQACDSKPAKLKPDATATDFAKLAWAIAHPARVQIVRLLIGREACMCGEIVDCLPLAQSTVSQHLKILKDSGLIQGEVDGPKVCYCINPRRLKQLKMFVADL